MLDCRTFMNSAHITWLLACLPASQPASHFAQIHICNWLDVSGYFMCKRVHVSMHHAKGITKYLAHTHTHIQKSLQMWSHAVWRKRKNWNKNRPHEREKVKTRVLVYRRRGRSSREREKVYKLKIYMYTNYTRIMCELSVCAIDVSTLLLLRTNKNKHCVKLCAHVF